MSPSTQGALLCLDLRVAFPGQLPGCASSGANAPHPQCLWEHQPADGLYNGPYICPLER